MNIIQTLLGTDIRMMRTWLRTKRVSKLFVIGSFGLLIGAVTVGIYFLAQAYFGHILSYGRYGALSASYVINAAILVTMVLMIMAAVASLVGFLLESSPEHEFLLSQPIPATTLPLLYFIRTTVINTSLMLVVFGPMAIAYGHVFAQNAVIPFAASLLFVLIVLVLIANCIATFIAFGVAYLLKRPTVYAGMAGLILFFLIMFGVSSLIFPQSLLTLSDKQSVDFLAEYYRLPITAAWLPTVWMTSNLTLGFGPQSILLLLLAGIMTALTFLFQNRFFVPLYHRVHPRAHTWAPTHAVSRLFIRHPFLIKDWLSVLREPAEAGYVFFLSGIAFLFFIFLRMGLRERYMSRTDTRGFLAVFAFLWLGFFVTAFLLRIIYPLMAREGTSRWFVFSLPIPPKKVLYQKMLFGYLATLPLALFTILVWFIIPPIGSKTTLIYFSLATVFVLTQSHVLLGSVSPDFANGDSPERVSTSAMGIVSLFFSFLYICTGAFFMYQSLSVPSTTILNSFIFMGLSLLTLVLLNIIAFRKQYILPSI